jgi:hypothetical protein
MPLPLWPSSMCGWNSHEARCSIARAGVVKPGNHISVVETGRYRIRAFGRVEGRNDPVR